MRVVKEDFGGGGNASLFGWADEGGGRGYKPLDVVPKVHIKELVDCGFLKIMIYCLCQKVKERGEIELPVGVRTLYI